MSRKAIDLLIVGTGIAGLYVALRAKEAGLTPVLITKSTLLESNTLYAQGGIAAAIGKGDFPRQHFEDTVRAGAGLVFHKAAWILATEAPQRIAELVRFGVPFDTEEGQVALGMEAAHSLPRVLHAGGDATGRNIEETLNRCVRENSIEVRERTVLLTILTQNDRAWGIVVRGRGGEETMEAKHVVLATGGGGRLFRESSNPEVATGEGVAMALSAGAVARDMEFVQFHPTTYSGKGHPRFLITEALRGEGAVLRNSHGERFMPQYDKQAELAPRDRVSRAIVSEMERLGDDHVLLDATAIPVERLRARFPTVCNFLKGVGLYLERDQIPVTPVAHYMVGGVATNLNGETRVRNLYACGEVASTGVHGANRLASNSLMEGLVFGERIVRSASQGEQWGTLSGDIDSHSISMRSPTSHGFSVSPRFGDLKELGELLWDHVGIIREGKGLKSAVRQLTLEWRALRLSRGRDDLPSPLENRTLTGLMMARGALTREESRGGHYRKDFPHLSHRWRVHVDFRMRPEGR